MDLPSCLFHLFTINKSKNMVDRHGIRFFYSADVILFVHRVLFLLLLFCCLVLFAETQPQRKHNRWQQWGQLARQPVANYLINERSKRNSKRATITIGWFSPLIFFLLNLKKYWVLGNFKLHLVLTKSKLVKSEWFDFLGENPTWGKSFCETLIDLLRAKVRTQHRQRGLFLELLFFFRGDG